MSNTDYGICSTRTLSRCTTGKEYVAVSQRPVRVRRRVATQLHGFNARMKREKENVRRVVVVQRVEHRWRHLFNSNPIKVHDR